MRELAAGESASDRVDSAPDLIWLMSANASRSSFNVVCANRSSRKPASVGCGGLPRRNKLVPNRCSRLAMAWLTADCERSSRSAARLKPPASITA